MRRLAAIATCMLLAVACSGPTRTGLQAREEAHGRMNSVNAELAAQQAKQHYEVGQFEKALTIIDGSIDRYPDNTNFHMLRGRILLEMHRLDEARASLESAATQDETTAEPWYLMGVVHQRWSDDEAALEAYTHSMDRDPTHPQYLLAAAESLAAVDRVDAAITLLEEKRDHFEHHPAVPALLGQLYLRQGSANQAASLLDEARMLNTSDSILLEDVAVAHWRAGQFAQCLWVLQELEADSGELRSVHKRLRGVCLAATGSQVPGRDLCLEVTRQTPDDPEAWADLGLISWQMGDYRRVAECGLRLSELAPGHRYEPLFRGVAALEAGNRDEALQWLQKAAVPGMESAIDRLIGRMEAPETAEISIEAPRIEPAEGSRPVATVLEIFSLESQAP